MVSFNCIVFLVSRDPIARLLNKETKLSPDAMAGDHSAECIRACVCGSDIYRLLLVQVTRPYDTHSPTSSIITAVHPRRRLHRSGHMF